MNRTAMAAPGRRGFSSLLGLALLLGAGGCASMEKPGQQSIAGMSPVGTINMTEIIAGGATAGQGTLNFQGQSYAFKLGGGVTGGGGVSRSQGRGEVYNLRQIADFAGLYTQNAGGFGLNTSTASDLWLRNTKGVVLHLTGTQSGMTLSLGREEVLVEMF